VHHDSHTHIYINRIHLRTKPKKHTPGTHPHLLPKTKKHHTPKHPGTFDVNVTPDKREVFLVQEARLLESLREALHALWASANVQRTFQVYCLIIYVCI
jgi:hypothetical protein